MGKHKLQLKAVFSYLCIIVVLFPIKTQAQGQYLQKGSNGISIEGAFTTYETLNSNVSGFLISGGFSANTLIDIGLSFGRKQADNQFIDDLSANSVSPYIKAYFFKQGQKLPFTLAFGLFIDNLAYSSDLIDQLQWKVTTVGFSSGLLGYHSFIVSRTLEIMPEFGILHGTHKLRIKTTDEEDIILI